MRRGTASYFDLIKLFKAHGWRWDRLIAEPLGTSKQHVHATLRTFVGHPELVPTAILQAKILARAELLSAIGHQLQDLRQALAEELAKADDETLRAQHLTTLTALAESLRHLGLPRLEIPDRDAEDAPP